MISDVCVELPRVCQCQLVLESGLGLLHCVLCMKEQWVWGRSKDEARQRAAVKYGVKPECITLTQGDSSLS